MIILKIINDSQAIIIIKMIMLEIINDSQAIMIIKMIMLEIINDSQAMIMMKLMEITTEMTSLFQTCICIWKHGKEAVECVNRSKRQKPELFKTILSDLFSDIKQFYFLFSTDLR